MGVTDAVALGALLVSVVSLVVTIRTSIFVVRWQARQQAMVANQTIHAQLSQMYKDNPTLVRFSGIEPKELEACGLTPGELAYLVGSLEAGSIYYDYVENGESGPFLAGSYRYQMCEVPAFQQAWPILERLFPDTPYRRRYQATLAAIRDRASGVSKSAEPGAAADTVRM